MRNKDPKEVCPTCGSAEQSELKQKLAFSLDAALIELSCIDMILERRPALASQKDRSAKIALALASAARYDTLLRRYGAHMDGCVARPDCTCGWEQIVEELRKGAL
jgi:hypothetical protein